MAICFAKSCTGVIRKFDNRAEEVIYQVREIGFGTVYTGFYEKCEAKLAKLRAAAAKNGNGKRYQMGTTEGY